MHFFESFIKSHIESHTSTIYVDFKEMSLPTLLQIYLLSITPPRTATKILTLEMTIFGLKMMVKSDLEIFADISLSDSLFFALGRSNSEEFNFKIKKF